MPIERCELDNKPGFRWGDKGKCYTYTAGDKAGAKDAKRRALAQAVAIGEQDGVYKEELEKDDAILATVSKAEVQLTIPISKLDGEKRIITGIVLEPNEVDAQNDTVKPETIERAAHNFLARYNKQTQLGLMHKMFGDLGLELVESYISADDFEMGGKPIKKGSWIMSVRVLNDDVWKRIKAGEITGFSIGGIATVSE